jgi:hypothetical protein
MAELAVVRAEGEGCGGGAIRVGGGGGSGARGGAAAAPGLSSLVEFHRGERVGWRWRRGKVRDKERWAMHVGPITCGSDADDAYVAPSHDETHPTVPHPQDAEHAILRLFQSIFLLSMPLTFWCIITIWIQNLSIFPYNLVTRGYIFIQHTKHHVRYQALPVTLVPPR